MNGPGDVRVLVVDDDAMVGEMIQAMLAHAGFRSIGRAASGRAAVEMAAQTHPDVVLMDISLPDMDGIEAAQRIADSAPVPVVILSAYDTPDLLERAARAGVGAYLVKPADAREMERAIAVARARFDDISALRNLNRALEGEIRERQQAQRELQASEERFRTAIDFTYNWEYWLAPDGHFVYVSPACERITGYTREEFEADPGLLAQITLPENRAKAEMRRAADRTAAEVQEAQFRIVTRWGEVRTIEQVSLPVFGAAGDLRGWRASNRDVTERLALEERLREARRVEAVGQLAGGLAHDLNNLLTVVRGYAELAREQAGNSDGLREDLDEILRAGDRAAGIIANLLAYSRQQLLRLAPTDLNALLARVRPGLCQTVGDAVQVRLLLGEGLPQVRIDAQRLEEGLYEMARNAAEAMPDGGTLTLETEVAQPDAAALAVAGGAGGASPGAYVRLRVADTGIGMEEEVAAHVFDPFFTTKGRAVREGLGLSAVYGLVRQVGGTVMVSSRPQEGTAFDLYLPVAV